MLVFDVALFITVILAAIIGWQKGFIKQIGQVIALVVSIIAARLFGPAVGQWCADMWAHGLLTAACQVWGYVLTFVVVFLVVWYVAKLLTKMLETAHMTIIDRIGGVLFKVAEWLILVSICVNIWLAIRPIDRGEFMQDWCPWRPFTVKLAPTLLGKMMDINITDGQSVENKK